MHNAIDFESLAAVRTEVFRALPAFSQKRKRDQPPATGIQAAPSTASASSPALPTSPALPALVASHTLPSSPASLPPPNYDAVLATLCNWANNSLRTIIAAAGPLPRQARALPAHFAAGCVNDEQYILSIRLQQDDKDFSFPLVVVPHAAAHKPWRQDILHEPLLNYRPQRFASRPDILVKHAMLIHVADLFVRPFALPLGSLTIDREDHNMVVYTITIPDGFDAGLAELFLQSFLYSSRLQKIAKSSHSSCRDLLGSRDPFCPVTLNPYVGDREAAHILDKHMGPSLFQLIAQGLHDDAKRTGRYGDLIQPWDEHAWSGNDLNTELNQVLLAGSLNKPIEQWAFLVLLDKPHDEDAFCPAMHQGLDLWNEPEPLRALPAVAFLNWSSGTLVPYGPHLNARRQTFHEDSLSGVTTVWHNPDSDVDPPHLPARPWPRPPNWFPAHQRFPPSFLLANTVASRMIKNFSSAVVDGFASSMPKPKGRDYALFVAHHDELRKRPAQRRNPDHAPRGGGDEQDSSSNPGNDPGDAGPAGDNGGREDESKPDEDTDESPSESSPKKPKLDDKAPRDTLAVLALALLSLAATYATVVEESDSDDDEDEPELS